MNHKRIENVFLICLMLGIYTVFVSNTGTGFPCLFRYFTPFAMPWLWSHTYAFGIAARKFSRGV